MSLLQHARGSQTTIAERGDSVTQLIIVDARSRRALSRIVREANWYKSTGCGRDCTGEACSHSAELLRAYRVNGEWRGVVAYTIGYDV